MKRQTVVILDDIDGTEGAKTYVFSLNGANYEIDLAEENAAKLAAAFEYWIGHSRKVARSRTRHISTAGKSSDVRAWLIEHGHDVPARGRLSAALLEEYYKAFPHKRPC